MSALPMYRHPAPEECDRGPTGSPCFDCRVKIADGFIRRDLESLAREATREQLDAFVQFVIEHDAAMAHDAMNAAVES